MPGLVNHKQESRLPGEISITPDTQMIPLMVESEEELKSILMKVKEESEKAGLNSTFKKQRSWNPVPSWQMDWEEWKQWQILFSWTPISLWMVTAAMKLKDFAPWKHNYDQLSILKSRDTTLLTKVCLVKAMIFPVVMCRCESWTTKMTEHWRIDAFELWCWRRLLRVPWTARSSTSQN